MSAEFLGTFVYVFAGCGTAVLASAFPTWGLGVLEVAAAFSLSYLLLCFLFQDASGCHLNPAVTAGLIASGRFPRSEFIPYTAAQVCGAVAAACCLRLLSTGEAGFQLARGAAANGYGEHSPYLYSLLTALLSELFLSFAFLTVFIAAIEPSTPRRASPFIIGLAILFLHIVGIPISNLSLNPARSTGPAILAGGWPAQQLWVFWLAPISGAIAAGFFYKLLFPPSRPSQSNRSFPC